MPTPEQLARTAIDAALERAGWVVQDYGALNVDAAPAVAVRECQPAKAYGAADYLLYVRGAAVGVIEAKKVGATLAGVEVQAEKYAAGIPAHLSVPVKPLPFLYQSTGVETQFTNRLDPQPRSRPLFHSRCPETLARWLDAFFVEEVSSETFTADELLKPTDAERRETRIEKRQLRLI